ncbi:hypothetical protein D3C83_202250 [compost metagenome]
MKTLERHRRRAPVGTDERQGIRKAEKHCQLAIAEQQVAGGRGNYDDRGRHLLDHRLQPVVRRYDRLLRALTF